MVEFKLLAFCAIILMAFVGSKADAFDRHNGINQLRTEGTTAAGEEATHPLTRESTERLTVQSIPSTRIDDLLYSNLNNSSTTTAAVTTTEPAVTPTDIAEEQRKEQSASVDKHDFDKKGVDNGRVTLKDGTIAGIAFVAVAVILTIAGVMIYKKRSQRSNTQGNRAMKMQDLEGSLAVRPVGGAPADVREVAPQPEVGHENMEQEPFFRVNHGVQSTDTINCGFGRPMLMVCD